MKRTILTLGLAFLLVVAFTVSAPACEYGCTPGYWKQAHHFGNWDGYSPETDYVDEIFGCGPHVTLLEALQTGGGGEEALTRHAVASLLNAAQWSCFDGGSQADVIAAYCAVYGSGDPGAIEKQKDCFETNNEQYCDLGRAQPQLKQKLYLIRIKK